MTSTPTILLTNDDGIDAPGLRALEEAAQGWQGARVVVAAPATPQSGCSHLTTMHGAIRVEERGPDRYAIYGSPADCVRLGLAYFAPGAAWVLSGINEGGNLGHDIYLSGTIGAAREAAFHGVRAIALSQYFHEGFPLDWAKAARQGKRMLDHLSNESWERGAYWNVNLPHREENTDPEIVWAPPCVASLPIAYQIVEDAYHYERGRYQGRDRITGTDVAACFGGAISVSRLSL